MGRVLLTIAIMEDSDRVSERFDVASVILDRRIINYTVPSIFIVSLITVCLDNEIDVLTVDEGNPNEADLVRTLVVTMMYSISVCIVDNDDDDFGFCESEIY